MGSEVRIVLEDGRFIEMHSADADFYVEGCDAAIDYTLYNPFYEEIDGGQMDYDSSEKGYRSVKDAILDVIRFALSLSDGAAPKFYFV